MAGRKHQKSTVLNNMLEEELILEEKMKEGMWDSSSSRNNTLGPSSRMSFSSSKAHKSFTAVRWGPFLKF